MFSYEDHHLRANMIMRYGISDCGTAIALNTFMYKEVIIHDDDMSKVIDYKTLTFSSNIIMI